VIRPQIVRSVLAPSLCLTCLGLAAAASPAGAGPLSASQLLSQGVSAADKAGSMSFNDHTASGKLVQTLTGAISAPTAAESLTTTGLPALQVMLVGTTIYVQAGASVLESTMGLPAAASTANAGKWISVQSGDSAFSQLSGQLTLSAELNTYIPATALRRGKTTTVAGHRVIPITGRPASSASNKGESVAVALYLSTKAPYLPVGGSLISAKKGTAGVKEIAVFSNWGKTVVLTAPTGAVPFSSLVGPT
jgi:hypothetical protein